MDKELTIVRFKARDLSRIHRTHLSYLLASSQACNEINLYRLYTVFENSDWAGEVDKMFVSARQMSLFRLAVARIFEFNNLTSKYIGAAKKRFPNDTEKFKRSWGPIARSISDKRWIRTIRDKFVSHYDWPSSSTLEIGVAPDQELSFAFGRLSGEVVYNFVDDIVSRPVYEQIGNGDLRTGIDTIFNTWNEIASQIILFHTEWAATLLDRHGLMRDRERVTADPLACANPGEYHIPVYVKA